MKCAVDTDRIIINRSRHEPVSKNQTLSDPTSPAHFFHNCQFVVRLQICTIVLSLTLTTVLENNKWEIQGSYK